MNAPSPRRPDLHEATRELVLPFVQAVRGTDRRPNEQPPQLRVYRYAADGITMIPVVGSGSARVTEILLSTELIDTTRENVRLLFDDVNDGTRVDPPVDYADPTQLQGWTLRALDEWVDYIVPDLANRYEPEAAFDSIYADFEARFFTDSYGWMWISPLANCVFHSSHIELEDGLAIRYLKQAELKLRHQGLMTIGTTGAGKRALWALARDRRGMLIEVGVPTLGRNLPRPREH